MDGWPSFTTMRMDLSPSIMSNTNVARGTIVAVFLTRMLPPVTVTFSSPNISLSAFALADSISVNVYDTECSVRTIFTMSPPHALILSSEASTVSTRPSSETYPASSRVAASGAVASVGRVAVSMSRP